MSKIKIRRKIGLVRHSFWPRKVIISMKDPQDDKSSHSVWFSKMLMFDLLIFLDLFVVFFHVYAQLILKEPVDRTKQHGELKCGTFGHCRIADWFLLPIFFFFENYYQFCGEIKIGLKIGLAGHNFWPRKLILSMRDPQDDKSSHFFHFQTSWYLTYLWLCLDLFGFFFLFNQLLILKEPVGRTKQHRDLQFSKQCLWRIFNRWLFMFFSFLKTSSCVVEKSKMAAK